MRQRAPRESINCLGLCTAPPYNTITGNILVRLLIILIRKGSKFENCGDPIKKNQKTAHPNVDDGVDDVRCDGDYCGVN